jgi:hypothetical protein
MGGTFDRDCRRVSGQGPATDARGTAMNPNLDGALKDARALLFPAKRAADPNRGARARFTDFLFSAASTHIDASQGADVVDVAERGDPIARAAVHHAIAWYLKNRVDLPDALRHYLIEFLLCKDHKKQPGRLPHQNYLRDGLIRLAVAAVEAHGFAKTRNPAAKSPSACSIVCQVLGEYGVAMSEKNVEAVASAARKHPKKSRGIV